MISPSSVGGLPSTIRKEFEEQSWLLACSADKKIDSGNAASPEKARFYSGCQWWCLPRDFQVSNFLAILWFLCILVIYGHIWLCQFVWWELQWKCLETSHAVPGSIHEVSETNPQVGTSKTTNHFLSNGKEPVNDVHLQITGGHRIHTVSATKRPGWASQRSMLRSWSSSWTGLVHRNGWISWCDSW